MLDERCENCCGTDLVPETRSGPGLRVRCGECGKSHQSQAGELWAPPEDELTAIADSLEAAERMGAECDTPEGARYVQLSDTWAKDVAWRLRAYAARPRGVLDDELDFVGAAETARADGARLALVYGVFARLDTFLLDGLARAAATADAVFALVECDELVCWNTEGVAPEADRQRARLVSELRWIAGAHVLRRSPLWYLDALRPEHFVHFGRASMLGDVRRLSGDLGVTFVRLPAEIH